MMSNFKNFKNKIFSLPGIKKENLYFSQMRDGYQAAHKPNYPKGSKKDFVIQTIENSGAYLRGNYELICFEENRVTALYFWDFEDMENTIRKLYNV